MNSQAPASLPPPAATAALDEWLAWLEQLHPSEIDLGLERVTEVARKAGLNSPDMPIITVAGTNGKGSVVETLMQAYLAAGYSVGAYTSPHLFRFNERIRLDAEEASDDLIRDALLQIETQRGATSLTYFEFTTLAAMQIFIAAKVDVVILEVGLGGRLDAVNLWDCDCAVVTSIGVDHEAWLGSDREVIAGEKAAVARREKPLVIGENDPPVMLATSAAESGARLVQIGRDFNVEQAGNRLQFQFAQQPVVTYSLPAMGGDHQLSNAGVSLAVIHVMQPLLPTTRESSNQALESSILPGRMQVIELEGIPVMIDVAHNAAAAAALAQTILERWPGYRVHALFSIMADKAVDKVLEELVGVVSYWYCGQLSVERALAASELAGQITETLQRNSRLTEAAASASLGGEPGATPISHDTVQSFNSVDEALNAAITRINQPENAQIPDGKDLVLVFGSFFTVIELGL